MITTLEKLQNIVKAKKKAEKEIEVLQEEVSNIENNRLEVAKAYIKEANLLSKCNWKASVTHYHTIHVHARFDDLSSDVTDLLNPSWHCSFELEEGVSIMFNDEDIELTFDDEDSTVYFLREHNIKVDTSEIEKEIKDSQNVVDVCTVLLSKMKS